MSGLSDADANFLAAKWVGDIQRGLLLSNEGVSTLDADVSCLPEDEAELLDHHSLQAIGFEENTLEDCSSDTDLQDKGELAERYRCFNHGMPTKEKRLTLENQVGTSAKSTANIEAEKRQSSSPQKIPHAGSVRSNLNPNCAVFTPHSQMTSNEPGHVTPDDLQIRCCRVCGNQESILDNWCDNCGSSFLTMFASPTSGHNKVLYNPGTYPPPLHSMPCVPLPTSSQTPPNGFSICNGLTNLDLNSPPFEPLASGWFPRQCGYLDNDYKPMFPTGTVFTNVGSFPPNFPYIGTWADSYSKPRAHEKTGPHSFPSSLYSGNGEFPGCQMSPSTSNGSVPDLNHNQWYPENNRHVLHIQDTVDMFKGPRHEAMKRNKRKKRSKSKAKTESNSDSGHTDVHHKGMLPCNGPKKNGMDLFPENGTRTQKPYFNDRFLVPSLNLTGVEDYEDMLTLIRSEEQHSFPGLCLPQEVIWLIFSYLSVADLVRCCRVCRQFYILAIDESLWRNKKIQISRCKVNNGILMKAAKRMPSSMGLRECDCRLVTKDGISQFFKSCGTGLQEFSVGNCNNGLLPGVPILHLMLPHISNLVSVDISWCTVDAADAVSLADAIKRLEVLRLNGCQELNDATIQHICQVQGGSLKVLELFGCFKLSNAAMYHIAENCRHLETLKIGQCHKICENGVDHIIWKTIGLLELDLRGVKKLVDNAVKKIAKNLLSLSTLVLANCPLISDAAVFAVAERMEYIRVLDVCGCCRVTDKSMQRLAASCPAIESLDVSSTKVTSSSVYALANGSCKKLSSLKLSFCSKITLSSLVELVTSCKSLRLLHLFGCKGVKDPIQLNHINPALDVKL